MITEPAPAKINLALHIRRRRPDGYHDLETLFAFAREGDVVTVEEAGEEDRFTITGFFASALGHPHSSADNAAPCLSQWDREGARRVSGGKGEGDPDNLVIRAAQSFRATFAIPRPHAITLEKNLPLAAGIGGGSADAAATLRALAKLHAVDPADPRLVTIARQLGADVPACLLGETAFATGRGDDLTPLPPLGDLSLLLINPGVPLSTAAMFASWDGIDRGGIAADGTALERARAGRNDFTAPAIGHAPVVAQVIDLLTAAPGCDFARLSGSGATCFGLFGDEAARDSAATQARANGWWALSTHAL